MLVIAIDKDNDYGRKGGVECPVVGFDDVLAAVNALGLADPEDSDANVGFAALKIAREVGGVPVIICGEGKGSFWDDMEINRQLDLLKERFGDDEVIVVTDGAEDESVLPVLSSKFRVVGVERVTVKQLEGVETFYYVVVKYLKELLSSEESSKLFLGVPGIVMLLFGAAVIVSTWYPGFYSAVKNFIVGVALLLSGAYVAKIGFRFDLRSSVGKDFITASTWFITVFAVGVGAVRGYQLYSSGAPVSVLVDHTVRFLFLALLVYAGGKVVSEYMNGRERLYYYASFIVFLPALYAGILLIVDYVLFDGVRAAVLVGYSVVIALSVAASTLVYRKSRKR